MSMTQVSNSSKPFIPFLVELGLPVLVYRTYDVTIGYEEMTVGVQEGFLGSLCLGFGYSENE